MLSFLKFLSPLELQVGNSSSKFNFQGRLGTWTADRTTAIPNEHAGRLDPAASHRPGPTAGPGAAGWECPEHQLQQLAHPSENTARGPRD
jgi:hypothetical protein